ncbi:putative HAF family extracellular repeat protein [Massilia sp. UYP11]|uniref:PKD domain-containing protein n=1 Tax=Massilia sp. UYP11 TaxID=1756385 RepID=UPI003D1DC882
MHVRNHTGAGRCAAPRTLSYLLCSLVFAGTASAQQPPGPEAAKKPHHPAAGKTVYRVINLAAGEAISASINASGQVAYSLTPDIFSAPINAYFYNGSSSQNVGSLDGPGDFARATGLTNSGRVVGVSTNPAGDTRTFIWSSSGGITDIGTLPGADEALEPVINNKGVITAIAHNTATGFNRGFRWSALGGITDLGVLAPGAAESSYPRAINDAGIIVGDSWAFGNDYHAFLWTFGTGMIDIHTNASNDSTPVGISAFGQVAGNYHVDGEDWRGYVWTFGTGMVDIAPPAVRTEVFGMTSGGRITGQIGDPIIGSRAMTWTQTGGLVDLGTLGGTISSGRGANNKGQVVGSAQTGAGPVHAYVWTAKEGMVDLNTRLKHAPPGIVLEVALGISDNGSIVAVGNTGLVLLKPVSKSPCGCPHSVGPIVASDMVAVGAPLTASVGVADERSSARYGINWHWGDGNATRTASMPAANGAGASATHSYTRPGIYTITAKVVDGAGASVDVSRQVVAYQPGKGMAAGAGAFISPLAASKAPRRHTGKARFSFIAPALDAQPPSAAAFQQVTPGALHFDAGDLDFVSKDLRRIAAQGAQGRFEGSGALNGKGGYRFTLATTASNAAGGQPGRISLKIWRLDPATGKEIVAYDNSRAGNGQVRAAPAGTTGRDTVSGNGAGDGGSVLAEGSIALY